MASFTKDLQEVTMINCQAKGGFCRRNAWQILEQSLLIGSCEKWSVYVMFYWFLFFVTAGFWSFNWVWMTCFWTIDVWKSLVNWCPKSKTMLFNWCLVGFSIWEKYVGQSFGRVGTAGDLLKPQISRWCWWKKASILGGGKYQCVTYGYIDWNVGMKKKYLHDTHICRYWCMYCRWFSFRICDLFHMNPFCCSWMLNPQRRYNCSWAKVCGWRRARKVSENRLYHLPYMAFRWFLRGFHVGKYTIVPLDMGDGLGGGFKHYLEMSPRTVGKWSNLTSIFQNGLKPPSWFRFWHYRSLQISLIAGVILFVEPICAIYRPLCVTIRDMLAVLSKKFGERARKAHQYPMI